MQCVQVKLELGHKATIRPKPTSEGYSHDWTVFVRGPEGSNIQHFLEKVVFHLHESFPKPKRVVKEPPYQVSESGYAGFLLPIEVHFKNREDPKKVRFEYDLFLHLEGPPINHIRCEKLTFQNPTEDFRRKLIKAGGVGILGPDGGTVLGQQAEPLTDVFGPPIPKTKSSPEPVKKHKHITKESSSRVSTSSTVASVQEPFVALFGQPIKTAKSSPDPKKLKESSGKLISSKGIKNSNGSGSSSNLQTTSNPPNISNDSKITSTKDKEKKLSSDNKSSSKRTQSPNLSEMKIPVKDKAVSKRPPSPSISPKDPPKEIKKRKRNSSSTSTKSHEKLSENRKQPKVKERDKKETAKPASEKVLGRESKIDGEDTKTNEETTDVKSSKKNKRQSDKNKNYKENVSEKLKNDSKSTSMSSLDDSPNSSISFSSLHISGKQGPLRALMAELDDQDDDDELVSPLSSDPPSPPRFSQDTPKSTDVQCSQEHKDKHSKKTNLTKSSSIEEPTEQNVNYSSPHQMELSHLISMQRQITLLQDRDNLQKIVDILEETGLFTINSETFDFDLCALDKETLKKIQNCLVAAF